MDIQELRSDYPSHDGALCEIDRLRGVIKRNKTSFFEQREILRKERVARKSAERGRDQLAAQLATAKRTAEAGADMFGSLGSSIRDVFGSKS